MVLSVPCTWPAGHSMWPGKSNLPSYLGGWFPGCLGFPRLSQTRERFPSPLVRGPRGLRVLSTQTASWTPSVPRALHCGLGIGS